MLRNTILVGFAEALSAPEVVWSLVDAGFEVVAFTRKGRASALRYSRHVRCHEICAPEIDLQAAISDLQLLLGSLRSEFGGGRGILLPLDDKALYLSNEVQLTGSWILAGPHGANADLALDKNLQVEFAQRAGFNVPTSKLARTATDVFDFVAAESYPIILKASGCVPVRERRVQSCRNWICANSEELNRAISQWAERVSLLVQSYIPGTGEGVFGLATDEGVRAWSAHQRLRMMNPEGSGSSACVSKLVSDDLKVKVQAFMTAAKWRGLFMIELLRDQDGTPWFIELNGRSWGSMALSRRQGLEYPAWHTELAIDQKSRVSAIPTVNAGLVCRNVGRELVHLLFVLRGAKSSELNKRTSVWKTLLEICRIRRKDTFYNWRADDPKVFSPIVITPSTTISSRIETEYSWRS